MLTPALLIQKKRDGGELTNEEITAFIQGLATGEVTDYQATAFLMAVFFKGMSLDETAALTLAMVNSGEKYDLTEVKGPKIDKHSTGGVGDKVSLILAPLAAACGLKVPMMSGRGLGHSGGTLDKLEAITGFDVHLSRERFVEILNRVGCAMIGQSEKIVPADKKLYALRDVTATVECIPLITASILSKKIAEGARGLVLDVKVGSGAFMKTRENGKRLARSLTDVARRMKFPCRAVLTDMNQPLGYAVGNALEVKECIEVLRNERNGEFNSADLKELTIQLTAQMLKLGGVVRSIAEGRKLAQKKLADGGAWRTFEDLVQAQGGSSDLLARPARLAHAPRVVQWKAKKRGYIARFETQVLGQLLVELGGGRRRATDPVNPAVGFLFHKKLGASVGLGDPIVTVYAPAESPQGPDLTRLELLFHSAVEISRARKSVPKLIIDQI